MLFSVSRSVYNTEMWSNILAVTAVFASIVVVSCEVGGRGVARAVVVALAVIVVVPLVVVRLEPAGILRLRLREAGLLRIGLVAERVSRVGLAVTWASRHEGGRNLRKEEAA